MKGGMILFDLNNKNAFITGSAQGIGRGIALKLAKYGANIIAADINEDGLQKTINKIKEMERKTIPLKMDVSDKKQVNEGVKKALDEFKTIDILVNCAGITNSSLLVDLKEEIWERVMDVNAKSVFLVSQAVAKNMIKEKRGKIINISSQAAKVGEAGNGVYCASKAAVSMLTQVFALELAQYNINVNAVCPGYVDTDIMQEVFEKRGPLEGMTHEQYKRHLLSNVPLKRMAQTGEIGELVAFLASDLSSYITGVSIIIAGGKTLI
jgi:NAD(P)-dependent dehydrogenase (short-subunit alcohol dehydrogenase family)